MSQLLIKAIENQASQTPQSMMYVIDVVSIRFGGYFTYEIKQCIQKYQNLQMLTLNDCAIISLQNFPRLPHLIRLDMVFNQIVGDDLVHLRVSRHIQTLMLGANNIERVDQVAQLQFMTNLMQLDLINNPVYRSAGYREKMYQIFPSLVVLDTLDRSGKDAFNNITMMETVSRIPQHLFTNQPDYIGFRNIHQQNRGQLQVALARVGSLQRLDERRKNKKARKEGKKNNKKEENIFPYFRILKTMKRSGAMRVQKASAIFLSAVLEHVTTKLLELAGDECKSQRKHKITPLILKDCLRNDEQYNKMLHQVTFGTMGQ